MTPLPFAPCRSGVISQQKMRRTSDFFSETLGALDEISICATSAAAYEDGDNFTEYSFQE